MEAFDLQERADKLDTFVVSSPVFKGLPPREQTHLREQYTAMQAYLAILDQRLADFEG